MSVSPAAYMMPPWTTRRPPNAATASRAMAPGRSSAHRGLGQRRGRASSISRGHGGTSTSPDLPAGTPDTRTGRACRPGTAQVAIGAQNAGEARQVDRARAIRRPGSRISAATASVAAATTPSERSSARRPSHSALTAVEYRRFQTLPEFANRHLEAAARMPVRVPHLGLQVDADPRLSGHAARSSCAAALTSIARSPVRMAPLTIAGSKHRASSRGKGSAASLAGHRPG